MRRRFLLAAVFVLVASGWAQAESLEGRLRQRGEAFATAMRSQGDALSEFARDHLESRVAAEGRVGTFAERMRAAVEDLGPVDRSVVQVIREALVFVYLRHGEAGVWQNYQFRVQVADGHRLQLVFLATAVEPVERRAAPLASDEGRRFLDRLLSRLEAQQPFSGVAVVSRGGKDAYVLVRGSADAAAKSPVTRASRFGMASGSKLFTAVAVLQLAQAGKLALSDPLAKHVPGFPNQAFARQATIEQLLTHTAGAGNYWDGEYEARRDSLTDLQQVLPFVLKHLGAQSAPGTFSYSNSGYLLLGLVVEAVSGKSYYDYVRQHVLDPAGMSRTGFPLRTEQPPETAQPYVLELGAGAVKAGVYLPVTEGGRGSSAGGASTTVDDLLRFADALAKGRLLDRSHLELLTRARVRTDTPDTSYGCGASVEASRGVVSYGHGGRAPGTHFDLRIYPELDTVLVVLSNYDTIAGPEISSALDHLIRNRVP